MAPEPRDIIWNNLSVGYWGRLIRSVRAVFFRELTHNQDFTDYGFCWLACHLLARSCYFCFWVDQSSYVQQDHTTGSADTLRNFGKDHAICQGSA